MKGNKASLSIEMTKNGPDDINVRTAAEGYSRDLLEAWIRLGRDIAQQSKIPFKALAILAIAECDTDPAPHEGEVKLDFTPFLKENRGGNNHDE